jgi:hypothetical protein
MSLMTVWTAGRPDAAAFKSQNQSHTQEKSFDGVILLVTGLAAIGVTVSVYMLAVSLGISAEHLATLTAYP